MLEDLAPEVEGWIRRCAKKQPAKAADLVLRLAEFHVPKLQRLTIDLRAVPLEDIAVELKRRESEE